MKSLTFHYAYDTHSSISGFASNNTLVPFACPNCVLSFVLWKGTIMKPLRPA